MLAIRATSVAGKLYFIVDMTDLWLQTKKENPELKCSHVLRTCRGYRNKDNDLKCTTLALKFLSHESQPESKIENEATLAAGIEG